jgi:crotonobetainyl-CoA:carnitine CoA-transferase CaiB-like acyl-CoA transferase
MTPLSGIRVLDLTWLLPGPFATGILADLGAEVIKIERPDGGDYLRERSPSLFERVNLGKRSVVLDLKSEKGLADFYRLVATSDIVIEGFRPGVAKRLRIDPEALASIKGNLIHLTLTGYGQTGPMAQRAGHDVNYLAFAGALSIPGHWGEAPRRSGLPVGDLAAALYAVINILAALRQRDRDGRGTVVDLAITDAVLHWSNTRFGEFDPVAESDAWAHVAPGNDIFTTADGKVVTIGLIEEKFWINFCEAVRRPDLKPMFGQRNETAKVQIRNAVTELIAAQPLVFWESVLTSADIPYAAVNCPQAALEEPQFVARGMVSNLEGPFGKALPVVALPGCAFGVTRFAPQTLRRAPELGADTDVLLFPTASVGRT